MLISTTEDLKAVVDSVAELNILLAKVAKEQELKIEPLLKINLRALSGLKYTVYRHTVANVRIVDSRGRVQTY